MVYAMAKVKQILHVSVFNDFICTLILIMHYCWRYFFILHGTSSDRQRIQPHWSTGAAITRPKRAESSMSRTNRQNGEFYTAHEISSVYHSLPIEGVLGIIFIHQLVKIHLHPHAPQSTPAFMCAYASGIFMPQLILQCIFGTNNSF